MQNLFEILLLSKISGCILIFLKKKHFIFRKFLTPLQIHSKDFKYISRAVFTKRLTLMTELKLEFSDMFGKPPALYIQTLAFLDIKNSNCKRT